jgi:hypothetical protein
MWLKELVHTATLNSDYATTFESLASKLAELKIDVVKKDTASGEIVARCLTCPVNIILWRCCSDKLVFVIKRIDIATTNVKIYVVANLFRFRTRKDEETVELRELISQLSI